MSLLHVFNGDSSLLLFREIYDDQYQTMVWREILCEGPAIEKIHSDDFLKTRAEFLSEFMGVSQSDYDQKWKKEMTKAFEQRFDEIVLWFEYDLFCQINMIAAISFFDNNFNIKKISLICVGNEGDSPLLKGLGELSPQAYPQLLKSRELLEETDIAFAKNLWKMYCSDDHRHIIKKANEAPSVFTYLFDAFLAHQKRFPSVKNGLNLLEETILKLIDESPKSEKEIVREMLRLENYYGFGDLQYAIYIDRLSELYDKFAARDGASNEEKQVLKLNDLGVAILAGERKFDRSIHQSQNASTFGGCSALSYSFQTSTGELLKNDDK